MTRRYCIAFVFALITFAGMSSPADAVIVQWDLTDVHVTDNPSITFAGFFDYDTVANAGSAGASPNWNITEFVGGVSSFVSSPSDPNDFGGFAFDSFSGPTFEAGSNPPSVPVFMALTLTGNLPFDGSVSSIPLIGFNGSCDTSSFNDGGACSGSVGVSGSLTEVSAVPLPPALPMFGAALIGLGGFAWRRRSKA